ncbi:MAG: electron transport complex subunit RsxE [Spirochaetales bacterium]|nr:electron transport complex subunit RsxE [Spirochaetales bacterium]
MLQDFSRGLFTRNPVFVVLIGLCPALAVTVQFVNAVVLGACVTGALLCMGLSVSLLRNFIPANLRIPAVLIMLTALTTATDQLLKATAPVLSSRLGIYVPLIAVNCLILGRAGTFAFTHAPGRTVADALGMGGGFTLALGLIAFFRELIGSGTITFFPASGYGLIALPGLADSPAAVIAGPVGAFLTVGLLMGLFNVVRAVGNRRKAARRTSDDEGEGKTEGEAEGRTGP